MYIDYRALQLVILKGICIGTYEDNGIPFARGHFLGQRKLANRNLVNHCKRMSSTHIISIF